MKAETKKLAAKDEEKTPVAKKKKEKACSKGSSSKRLTWSDRLVQCKEYREKFGNCKIPTCIKDDGHKSLGIWVQEVRRNYKLQMKGEKPRRALTEEQIEQLDELEFHWGFKPDPNAAKELDSSWEANFQKIQEYKGSNGDFDVPMEGDTAKLATWARVQRTQKYYRDTKRKCFITTERIKKLKGIGFDWDGERKIE